MKVCACGKCHKKKGCGKELGNNECSFKCGEECDWCDNIHYCEKCKKKKSMGYKKAKEGLKKLREFKP